MAELKIVPRVNNQTGSLQSDLKFPAASNDLSESTVDEVVEEVEDKLELVEVPADAVSEPKSDSQVSQVDSPEGKLKRSGSRSLGELPKLCNPAEIATVHRDHLSLLNVNFLPLITQEISSEQFFHRIYDIAPLIKAETLSWYLRHLHQLLS